MRFPRASRLIALGALLGATTLLSLAPSASAHWIHDGCEDTALWADAWAAQMTQPPSMTIEKHTLYGGVEVYTINWQGGDPFSAIICLEGDWPIPGPNDLPVDIKDPF